MYSNILFSDGECLDLHRGGVVATPRRSRYVKKLSGARVNVGLKHWSPVPFLRELSQTCYYQFEDHPLVELLL